MTKLNRNIYKKQTNKLDDIDISVYTYIVCMCIYIYT